MADAQQMFGVFKILQIKRLRKPRRGGAERATRRREHPPDSVLCKIKTMGLRPRKALGELGGMGGEGEG